MKFTIEALLVLAGFAAGVLFSGVVHAFVASKVSQLETFAREASASAKSEADALRARVVELEQKVRARL